MAEIIKIKNLKDELVADIAAIAAMDKSDLPTKTVGGVERPVHEANYKRKLEKIAKQTNDQKLIALAIAPLVAAGYPDAAGRMRDKQIVIYPDGLPVAEEL